MKQIILILSILMTSIANSEIAKEEDTRYDINISIDGQSVEELYLLSVFYRDKYDRKIGLKWLDNNHSINLKQYENTLKKIFILFHKDFPNKKMNSIRLRLGLVESTYNILNNDAKKHLKNRKGLATMKDKKLHKIIKESFLKTKQIEITCSLAIEILHQECQSPPIYLDPVAIKKDFHKKRLWKELAEEDYVLSRRGLISILFEN